MTAARTRRGASWRAALAVTLAASLAATLLAGGDGVPAEAGPATSPLSNANAPAASATAVSWTGDLAGQAPCPEGTTRSSLLHREGFEVIPQQRFNNGWYRITGVEGNYAARALVDSSDPVDHMFLPYVQGTRNTRTMLAFATKSSQPDSSYTRTQVNSVDLRVPATGSWAGRVFDVTAATLDENGWLGAWFEHRTKGGVQSTWDVDNLQIYTCRTAPVSRISGSDRYASAARIAETYPAGVPVAYLATGANYPDALSASALAGHQDAPVLLTRPGSLPTATRTQLGRLRPQQLVVLGGTGAVSSAVEQAASAYAGTTTRVQGENRYDVSAGLARSYRPGVPVLYVASGADFPDALSIGALAGRQGAPLLLTRPHELPQAIETEVARLNPGRIVVVGGPVAVQDRVVTDLRSHTSGAVTRVTGGDRYQVSAAVAGQFPTGQNRVYVATGATFPDALVGAARAGSQGVPVVLSRSTSLPGAARQAITSLDAARGVLLGGPGALSSLVMDQVGARVG
ncbi:cell wall-binding repeat-containing protein [Ornithinimicrobium pratense]|nr:cell wall-binding repeat-containing protein [Ornithinimicrobium pratense]